jgi:hypothetical protein
MNQLAFKFRSTREDLSIEERFADYHARFPEIYSLFVQHARAVKEAGFNHYGAKTLFETIRYHCDLHKRDEQGFKLNNIYTPYYARKLMDEYPDEFGNFFETRKVQASNGR